MNQESIPGPEAMAAQNLVRGRRHFGLSALFERVAHQVSSVSAAALPVVAVAAVTAGWTATTRWCSRPPSACSSWYFATSEVTACTSSLVKAAAIGGGCEPHPAVHRERRELLLRPGGTGDQITDIADKLRGQGQQPAGRQTIRRAGRIGGHGRQRRRRDHVGGRRGLEQALGHVPLATLLHQLYQPVSLQRPQVVVDFLPGQADGGGEHRRRPRLGQLSQQARSGRLQRGLGGGRIGDHCYIDHETSLTPDKNSCQEKFSCRSDSRTKGRQDGHEDGDGCGVGRRIEQPERLNRITNFSAEAAGFWGW